MLTRNEILLKLGQRISRERKKRGLTIEKLAYEMGMSKGNLSDIEKGKRDPRYTTLRAICLGLGVSAAQILKELD